MPDPRDISPDQLDDVLAGRTVERVEFEHDPSCKNQRLRLVMLDGTIAQFDTWCDENDPERSGFDSWDASAPAPTE